MGLSILVVEDNAFNQRLFQDILEFRGHQVATAMSVPEAWERLRTNAPDLVLLDVQIPGGGGERLVREIRSDEALSGLPVIAVTALAMSGDQARLLAAGFDGYLSKPIDTRTFCSSVESFAKKQEGSGDVR